MRRRRKKRRPRIPPQDSSKMENPSPTRCSFFSPVSAQDGFYSQQLDASQTPTSDSLTTQNAQVSRPGQHTVSATASDSISQLRARLAQQEAENKNLRDRLARFAEHNRPRAADADSPRQMSDSASNPFFEESSSLKYVGLSLFNAMQDDSSTAFDPEAGHSQPVSPGGLSQRFSYRTPSPAASLHDRNWSLFSTPSAGSSTTELRSSPLAASTPKTPLTIRPSGLAGVKTPSPSRPSLYRAASYGLGAPHGHAALTLDAPPFVPSPLTPSSPLCRSPKLPYRNVEAPPLSLDTAGAAALALQAGPYGSAATMSTQTPLGAPYETPFLPTPPSGPSPGRGWVDSQQGHSPMSMRAAIRPPAMHPYSPMLTPYSRPPQQPQDVEPSANALHRIHREHPMMIDPPTSPVIARSTTAPVFHAPHANSVVPATSSSGHGRTRSHYSLMSSLGPDALVSQAMAGRSQEASIILQQQLKSSTPDRQAAILRALAPHLPLLSEDKHGNFLVQRAIGVDGRLAWELKGHFAHLALSQYGCHVVQRVLDEDEHIKMQVVDELLSKNLLETLTSRNSVHVWAKALETKWTNESFRRRLYETINQHMKGRWASIAMQETGSIVVQNLFESADDDEKQDCVQEILSRLAEVVVNQWGVWVAQHIIEYGTDEHRRIAFEALLSDATVLSLSQYGQKAVMTALKTRDAGFIQGYVDRLCGSTVAASSTPPGLTAAGQDTTTSKISSGNGPLNPSESAMVPYSRSQTYTPPPASSSCSSHSHAQPSGRRSMLVDVASSPPGLQIITQLLTTVSQPDRQRIIAAVRRNSVFLKGSKSGLKVVQMCERARAFTGY